MKSLALGLVLLTLGAPLPATPPPCEEPAPLGAAGEEPAELGAAAQTATAVIPPGRVLWIGAHPDDEVLLAPLLGELCAAGGRRCAFLVATRGENGACRLPAGCHPDLGTVRSGEMRAAARLFHAQLLQGSLPDVAGPDPAAVRWAWDDAVGGDEVLLARLAGAIASVAPRTVITFDPRHGTTCHNAHRAVGRLVLRALAQLSGPAPEVFLLESRVQIAPEGASIDFSAAVPGDPAASGFDANAPLAGARGTAWDYLLEDALRQPSQFDATFLHSLRVVPRTNRAVYLMPAAALASDPAPAVPCPQ
ncbi:MAG TPA: PIG-L family deacetylase [Thermoanaerobaculia bacterium]|jgi:LmbE family N-acetylglucosaminyl deacetylase|nr:PIG-L family deacetylase [Thermoanaerobaculia bacterium]